jgi:FdhE protein
LSKKSPKAYTDKKVTKKILDKLAEAEQPLPDSLELYRLILTTQSKFKLPALSKSLPLLEKKAQARLAQSKPMITFSDLKIDWNEVQKTFQGINKLASEFLDPEDEEIEELNRLASDQQLLKSTVKKWFGIGTVSRKSTAKDISIDPVIYSIIQASMHPLLAAYADGLLHLVHQKSWNRRYCPVCGGSPDFAFLDKEKEGLRWLLCSRCDAQWRFFRIACPYCDNRDQKSLACYIDEKGTYRLYVCEMCHRYIKTIDERKAESEVLLPLERVLTLDMDRQAYESNYTAE